MMTVSPFLCEEVTFFTFSFERTASLTCDSHILHIMPSIFTVVLYISFHSFQYAYHVNALDTL